MPNVFDGEKKYIMAFIPARGGSKKIHRKNILDICGFPLIAYSISVAKLSKSFDRIIVITDDDEIASIAKYFGAEVPFKEPAEVARDDSKDLDFVSFTLQWLKENREKVPDYIVHLRVTSPLRQPKYINQAISVMLENPEATALRSAHESLSVIFKDFLIREDGYFSGLFPHDTRPEYFNLPRQNFPKTFHSNGYVDVIVSKTVLSGQGLHGDKMLPFITKSTDDIDTLEHVALVIQKLKEGDWEIYRYLKKNF